MGHTGPWTSPVSVCFILPTPKFIITIMVVTMMVMVTVVLMVTGVMMVVLTLVNANPVQDHQ